MFQVFFFVASIQFDHLSLSLVEFYSSVLWITEAKRGKIEIGLIFFPPRTSDGDNEINLKFFFVGKWRKLNQRRLKLSFTLRYLHLGLHFISVQCKEQQFPKINFFSRPNLVHICSKWFLSKWIHNFQILFFSIKKIEFNLVTNASIKANCLLNEEREKKKWIERAHLHNLHGVYRNKKWI